jgi:hypothetical protein
MFSARTRIHSTPRFCHSVLTFFAAATTVTILAFLSPRFSLSISSRFAMLGFHYFTDKCKHLWFRVCDLKCFMHSSLKDSGEMQISIYHIKETSSVSHTCIRRRHIVRCVGTCLHKFFKNFFYIEHMLSHTSI